MEYPFKYYLQVNLTKHNLKDDLILPIQGSPSLSKLIFARPSFQSSKRIER